jgi:hypothetical protein
VVEDDRWGLLQLVRDTAPEIRRFVLASDVRRFRLYYAIKAGLVDGLIDPKTTGDGLARLLLGATAAAPSGDGRRRARPRERKAG